jgi:hypothetical protein
MEQPRVPWYEAVVAYGIVVPAVVTWFVGVPLLLSYWGCMGGGARSCASTELLRSSTGSYTGIVLMTAFAYVVALTCATVVQIFVRKLHFVLVWAVATLCLTASFYAYGVLSGLAVTPWGHLVQFT